MKNRTHNLAQLLTDIIEHPAHYSQNTLLINGLKSQGGIAALSGDYIMDDQSSLTLSPMSLNTLKAHANALGSIDFKEIDRLRKLALNACTSQSKLDPGRSKRTKAGISTRLIELEAELDLHRKSIVILLQALSSALNDFKNIRDAKNSQLREKRASDAEKTLLAIIRMNSATSSRLKLESSSPANGSVVDLSHYRVHP